MTGRVPPTYIAYVYLFTWGRWRTLLTNWGHRARGAFPNESLWLIPPDADRQFEDSPHV